MSSSITIPKICLECNSAFIAKTTVTRFCSTKCAGKAYKKKKRNEKIVATQKQEYEKSVGVDMSLIQSKEYLSIKETCLLLGISRMTLHRYIKKKIIVPSNIGGRVIIKKQVIINIIN